MVERDHKANSFDLTLTGQRVTPIHHNASSHACPEEPNLLGLIPALRAFARSLCGRLEEADDLVEETLAKGIADIDDVKRFGLKPWILGLMGKTFRARRGKAEAKDEGSSGCLSQASAAQSPGSMPTSLKIAQAMDRLPELERHAIVLVCMIGLLHEEAADICGCDTATIKRRLHKAKARLAALAGPVSRPAEPEV